LASGEPSLVVVIGTVANRLAVNLSHWPPQVKISS